MPGVQADATQQEIDATEQQLRQQVRRRAATQIDKISGTGDVHVRDILPELDFDADDGNNDNGWTTAREWLQSGMSADTLNQVYEIDPNNRAEDKVIGIYGFSNIAGTPLTSEIQFEEDTGGVFERAQVQEVFHRSEDTIALLYEPIIANAGDGITIKQWCTDAGTDKTVYHGATAEKAGTELARRESNRTPRNTGGGGGGGNGNGA